MQRWWLASLLALGCDAEPDRPVAAAAAASPETVVEEPAKVERAADEAVRARGQALVGQFECNRCHTITAVAKPKFELDCAGCHLHILGREVDPSSPLEAPP